MNKLERKQNVGLGLYIPGGYAKVSHCAVLRVCVHKHNLPRRRAFGFTWPVAASTAAHECRSLHYL